MSVADDLQDCHDALARLARAVPTASERELDVIAAVASRLGAAAEKLARCAYRRAQDVPAPASTWSPSSAAARDNVAPAAAAAISSAAAVGGGTTDSGAPAGGLASPFAPAGAVDLNDQEILFDTEGG